MIRIRSQMLLSGVSALAMLTAFGVVDPVLAAGTDIDGPGNVPAIDTSTILVGNRDYVDIDTNANVLTDGSGRSFYNPLTGPGSIAIGGTAGTALEIDDSILQGSIVNGGIISSTSDDGVNVDNSIVKGGLTNSGLISGGFFDGIEIQQSIFSGGINNSGTILGGTSGQGIEIDDTTVFSGGITNSGLISGEEGIHIDNDVSFSGGINNSGTIAGTASYALHIDADSFSGGVTNSGLIESQSGNTAINISADVFSGGINNTASGTISGTSSGATAINISSALFQGGITNAGLIQATSNSAYGIQISSDTFQGGINNSGSIFAASWSAVYLTGNLFQGGITNSGVIESDNDDGLDIQVTTFQDGIRNEAGGVIQANENGIYVGSSLFEGGITNAGLIESTGDNNAIEVAGSTFNGGIRNTGTLLSGSSTDAVLIGGTTFNGGITNSGVITGDQSGIDANGTFFNGGINNQAGGRIDGDSGPSINISATNFTGGITNAGTIGGEGNATTGILFTGGSFAGGINNSGTISGTLIGINLQGSVFDGGLTNSGLIESTGSTSDAVRITTTTFNGGVNNTASGVIRAADTNTALYISNTTFAGGITNAGQILSGTSSGYAIYASSTTFSGGINNTGTISADDTAIYLSNTSFSGGIVNSGLIVSTETQYGIYSSNTTFTGGINNSGTITAGGTAIYLNDSSFDGGVTNSGLIQGTGTGFDGIYVTAGTFSGGINNSGTIYGDNTGVLISNGTFAGGLTNSGTIASTNTGLGVSINTNTFTGGINNSGLIKGEGATGLYVTATTFDGGLTNSGTISGDYPGLNISVTNWTGGLDNSGLIQGTGTSADGVRLNATNFTGDFTNSGNIFGGTANNSGVDLNVTNFFGNFTNSGTITGFNRGVFLNGKLFAGNVSNSGSIDSSNGEGLRLAMTLLAGDVTNDGDISARFDALKIRGGTTVTGDVTNNGTITSTSSDAVDINGVVQGALTNTGVMQASGNALDLDGTIVGGIFNSGTMLSWSEGAVDLTNEAVAHTLTQTAGGFISDSGGEGNYAIDMSNGFVDTFNANGGDLEGDIIGGGGEGDVMVTQSGTFAWWRGTGTGLDMFDVTGGTSILGAHFRGDAGGEGVDVTANTMNVGGQVYLDDDTLITLNTSFVATGTGTVEYFLTTNTGVHGVINAPATTLAGNVAAFIDPASFAALVVPTTTTLVYDDVLNSASNRTGTFANSASIITSSIFFAGEATYDGDGDVDLGIRRLAFNDALNAIGATESQNQDSVAAAIETIYDNGGYSGDFQDFLEVLFGGGLTAGQFQTILNDIGGAEHAQLEGAVLSLQGILNGDIGDRLDGMLLTQGGTQMGMADLANQRYAQAAGIAASDASGPGGYGSHGLNRGPSGVSIWARGFGQWVNVDTDPEAPGYNQDSSGLSGGADYAINNNAAVGAAASYATTNIDFDTPGDFADVDSWQAGAYGSYGFGNFYADGLLSYGSHDVSTIRTILPPVPGAPFSALASYNATAWSAAAEAGAIWRLGRVNVQPSAALAYTDASTDGFTETGNGGIFNLIVQGSDSDSLASTLALRGTGLWTMGQTRVVPDIKIGWRHEFNNDRQTFTAAFSEDPTTLFNIVSSQIQPDSAVVRAGATFGLTQNFEVFVVMKGDYSSDSSLTNASGGVRLTW